MTAISIPIPNNGTRIPRIIHQTYSSFDLPPVLASNVESLKANNPSWEHRFYDNSSIESYILEYYGRAMLNYYNRIDRTYGVARADLFRYLVVYRDGGIYLDIKSRFDRPINDVLHEDDVYVLSQWRNGPDELHEGWGLHIDLEDIARGEFQQWHVIAAPGHPFLRAVIEQVIYNIEHYKLRQTGVGWTGVIRTTGPIAYSRAIMPIIKLYPHRMLKNEDELSLVYSIMERSSHQGLFRNHYTTNTSPVIRRPGIGGKLDRLYVAARLLKLSMRNTMSRAASDK